MSAYAAHFKEIIAKMPVTFEMKEVDEFCKNAKKDIKSKFNEEKKEKKAQPKKRVKKVDEDGNDIVKVKKPLSKYLQFLQDNRQKVIEENPGLKSKEYMSLLATLWNKHKEDNKEDSDEDNKKDSEDDSDITVAVIDSDVIDNNPCGLSNKVGKKATKAVDKQKKEKDDKKKV